MCLCVFKVIKYNKILPVFFTVIPCKDDTKIEILSHGRQGLTYLIELWSWLLGYRPNLPGTIRARQLGQGLLILHSQNAQQPSKPLSHISSIILE